MRWVDRLRNGHLRGVTDVVETGRYSCFARADPVVGKRRRIAAVSHLGKEGETCRSRRAMNEFSNGCEW